MYLAEHWRKRKKKKAKLDFHSKSSLISVYYGKVGGLVERLTNSYNTGENQTSAVKNVHHLRW